MTECKYGTDTGRPWCNCAGAVCTEVECRNAERLLAILPDGAGRTDGAAFHTRYAEEDCENRAEAEFVLVRSRYCTREHCRDFVMRSDADVC